MKKKFFLVVTIICAGFLMLGCENSLLKDVKQNLSECAKVYYFGENDNFYCTLSSGVREEEYFMDGMATGCVDYALLSLHFYGQGRSGVIAVEVCVGEEVFEKEMEFNAMNGNYMVDLETQLSGQEQISVKFGDEVLALQCISNDFAVDWNGALSIACEQMRDKIELKKTYSSLGCEFYLRVLDKKANNYDQVFWCLTILNVDNENFSIVISTEDGSVLAKSN